MGNYCEYALVYKPVEYTCNYVEIISYKRWIMLTGKVGH